MGNESFVNAQRTCPHVRDLEILTGIKVAHSTQHRLVNRYQLPEAKITKRIESLSVRKAKLCQSCGRIRVPVVGDDDLGVSPATTICASALRGTVRLRTPLGKQSEWKNYKAVKIHDRIGMAFFQDNESLLSWVARQPLSRTVNCLGDGHDGVWNIVEQIGSKHQRREILDWYHLMENLHKVGGSNQRLRQAKNFLWHGRNAKRYQSCGRIRVPVVGDDDLGVSSATTICASALR